MKKTLTRILAVLLISMMLIPMLATFAVSAEETDEAIDISDIVNVYELNQLNAAPNMEKVAGAMDLEPTYEEGVLASKPFEVTHTSDGDRYIYVGPCPEPSYSNYTDLIAYWYKKDGASGGSPKKIGELSENIVDRFDDGSVILKIKAAKIGSSYAKYAALKLPNTYSDFILATCERPFTVEEYFAYADAQGWNLDGTALRPAPPVVAEDAPEGYEGLWNYFQLGEDYVAPSTQKDATNKYVTSGYIPVAEGDVITIGGISTKETQSILYEYGDEQVSGKNTGTTVTLEYKLIKQYKKGDIGIDFVENIGYDYAIYSYTVKKGVSFVKVLMPDSTCANGDVLVTKNQEFNGAQFREALEIPELSEDAKNHAFYGKNALFVGDSIFLGEYDTPSSYGAPTASFARRLALATGLIPTVYAANGATIAKTGKSNVKYAYDLLKTALISKKNYDMIIFQGGIGDARNDIAVGEILPYGTEREVLAKKERTATFAGALQLMFKDTQDKWPEAQLYYVASYKTLPATVNEKDMGAYYAQAKALCEMYGIHYIDLYNDAQLYTTFDYENTDLFADDYFTPISETYDLLFPAVLRLFNEVKICVEHIYSNTCDESCNNCGCIRSIEHTYDNACDTTCNVCTFTRDTEHVYENACDAECDKCGNIRPVAHITTIYLNFQHHWFVCESCGELSELEEHVYSSDSDSICNICGHTRVIEEISTTQPEETTIIPDDIITPTPEEPETPGEETATDKSEETTTIPEEVVTPDTDDKHNHEEHVCKEVSGWKAFWNSIINFFRSLFGQPELCTCGEVITKVK